MSSIYLIIAIFVALVILITYLVLYNKLQASKQNVLEAWSGIDVQLKRRHELIPNLVDTVNAYAKHETDILEYVTRLRSQALSLQNGNSQEKSEVEGELEKAIKSILSIAEGYPDLKANTNYLKLQDQISETEDQIASSRRIYNSNVADYNTLLAYFPINLIAKMHHFMPSSFFQNS